VLARGASVATLASRRISEKPAAAMLATAAGQRH